MDISGYAMYTKLLIKMVISEFEYESCIRGYHIYKDIWSSSVGEHLICERETWNSTDRYAIAVLKDDVIIGRFLAKGLMLLKTPSGRVGIFSRL